MKRSIFLKVMAGALVLPALGAVSSTPTAQAAATPTTDACPGVPGVGRGN
jgi:hypothetical protein